MPLPPKSNAAQRCLWPHSHEPGLGQVSPEDGLDDSNGFLLYWTVFRRGDGAWDTRCGRPLQLMTTGERPVWGYPAVSKCSMQVAGAGGMGAFKLHPNSAPHRSLGGLLLPHFKDKPAQDVSKGPLLDCPWHGMGGTPGTSAQSGRLEGCKGLEIPLLMKCKGLKRGGAVGVRPVRWLPGWDCWEGPAGWETWRPGLCFVTASNELGVL